MPADSFHDASWYRATSLSERLVARAEQPNADDASASGGLDPATQERGERRLQRWRADPHFASGRAFENRLASAGLTKHDLRGVLGEPTEQLGGRFAGRPDWLAALEQAFDGPEGRPLDPQPQLPDSPTAGFLAAIRPLIDRARRRVRTGARGIVAASPAAPFDPETVDLLLFAGVAPQLLLLLGRTLVLEMHIARLSGTLPQETPEERLAAFQARLCQPAEMVALLQEYPVLARQLVRRLDQWATFSLEFLGHLAADWDTLSAAFAPSPSAPAMPDPATPDRLVRVDGGQGDGHRDGRAVLLAHFASGLGVVYKPRSLAVEAHFQELLGWLNERGDHPPFRTLMILDRGEYGWAELVEPAGCTSTAELGRFYERQGAQLALLYAIEATDFHYENVLAAGEQPVLLDLETLFHPRVVRAWAQQTDELVDRAARESVLRVGLIGWRVGASAESAGLDVSGLSAAGGQLVPNAAQVWQGAGDELRVGRANVELPPTRNRPTLNGADVDPLDYAEAFERGFTALYQLLVRRRTEFLAEGGPLARFADAPVRVIMRPTQTYMTLLRASSHPDVLRDALEQDRLFDRLWTRTDERPALARITPLEQEDLRNGDVPLFSTSPASTELWNGAGTRVSGLIGESGLELVRGRISAMGPVDLTRQVGLVRAALATIARTDRPSPWPAQALPANDPAPVTPRDQHLAAASAVGDRLLELALRDDDAMSWLGLGMPYADVWAIEPLWSDLYDGLPGVALFLAYLGQATGRQQYTSAAEAALATLRAQLPAAPAALRGIGAFTGLGGLIYALTHLGVVWDRPGLLDDAESLVAPLAALVEQDDQFDLVGGAAGAIVTLLTLQEQRPTPATLAAAVRCGEHLLDRAIRVGDGLGWSGRIEADGPLAGLAHGAAGIGAALLQLAAATGDARFRIGAQGALTYERTLFDPATDNWRDLRAARVTDGAPPALWCYGAPGIGLARLRALRFLDDPRLSDDVSAALRATRAQRPLDSHTLCHGTLGNIELLLQAADHFGEDRLRVEADQFASVVLDQARTAGWRCATPLKVETPGLMNGLAGIGFGLLRLADPVGTPSVLSLDGPRQRHGAQVSRRTLAPSARA